MKKIIKLIITAFFVFTLIAMLSLTAFAAENEAAAVENGIENGNTGEGFSENNTFEAIYTFFTDNSDKIFSALAFLGSLILAFTYKRGLIPTVNNGLGRISTYTKKLSESTEDYRESTNKTLDMLLEKFASLENNAELSARSIDELVGRLDALEKGADEKEKFKTVMLSQIDMLYEIFMNSSLPQYSKDALGEKMAEMKKSICRGE